MQTILITGAANGIGRATAMHFHGLGWQVIGLDTDTEALAELRGALPRESALFLSCDVGRESEVRNAFEGIGEWLGECPLDCLVNNAGIADPVTGPLEELELAEWQTWIDASLTGAFLVTRASLAFLRRSGGASIANISSTRAVMSEPDTFAYAAAKGGIIAFTRKLSHELGPSGINVNAIAPSLTLTERIRPHWEKRNAKQQADEIDRTPLRRVAEAVDQARVIAFLSSRDADFITGLTIDVTGGIS